MKINTLSLRNGELVMKVLGDYVDVLDLFSALNIEFESYEKQVKDAHDNGLLEDKEFWAIQKAIKTLRGRLLFEVRKDL